METIKREECDPSSSSALASKLRAASAEAKIDYAAKATLIARR